MKTTLVGGLHWVGWVTWSVPLLENVLKVAVSVVEACGATIICIGAALAFVRYLLLIARVDKAPDFISVRVSLGRHLILGLEFQLAADLLRSAVSPTFYDIGQLAAIAALRTVLNYFLTREIAEARSMDEPQSTQEAGPGT
ncbi:DUF1622 domain-containing protein [Streptomyces sp. NPDC001914]|uniref:DUF1622 domain-containing protein n=1 Tax=Streptomyces sp. NPDC001914 TaxID=3364623 RepID=UPI0036CB8C4B